MTLRFALSLLFGVQLTISVTARADVQPGVWSQLQHNGTRVKGKITGFDVPPGRAASVSYRAVGMDRPGSQTAELCRPKDSTDVTTAVEYNQQLQLVRDARKSGEIVELSINGPWNPCLVVSELGSDLSK